MAQAKDAVYQVHIYCTQCGQVLKYQERRAGKRVKCPTCAFHFYLPEPEGLSFLQRKTAFATTETLAGQEPPFLLEAVLEPLMAPRTICQGCGSLMKYQRQLSGTRVKCSRCGHRFRLPAHPGHELTIAGE